MHVLELIEREHTAGRLDVDGLSAGHPGRSGGLRQRSDHAQAGLRFLDHVGIAREDFEGEHLQRVADENGGCFVEGAMTGGPAAAQIVIVHRWQIIVHERVRMNQFDCACGAVESARIEAEHLTREVHEQGTNPLAAAERRIAHRLGKAGPLRGIAAILGEQAVQPRLDGLSHAFELCEKGHLGESVKIAALRRKRLGDPYPNTTLLKAATRRYKAAYGNSGGVRRAHA